VTMLPNHQISRTERNKPTMSMTLATGTDTLRALKQRGRRLRGRYDLRNVEVSGSAPARLVAGLQAATRAPSAGEREWAARIELLRHLMLLSPQPLEITDYGAGKAAVLDDGDGALRTAHTSTRTLGDMARSSKKPHWARLLHNVVRELRPATCLELGACVGISACYQAAALELNGAGRLVTLEGAAPLAGRSRRTLEELGLDGRASVVAGQFADTLPEVLADLAPLDYAFIDGHHTEAATLEYMTQIMPHVSEEAVLVFDDIDWSPGMRKAWQQIAADPRFALTVDLGTIGFTAVSASATGKQSLSVSYG
jgi:predicted O-methyltransferase YrrM